jgi:uncharacterized protein YndB with AHSA1/START domain
MTEFEFDVVIDRPAEEVFAFVTNPANVSKWQTSIVEMRQTTDGPVGVGTRLVEVRHFLGRRFEVVMDVIEHEPSKRYRMRISGAIPGTVGATFAPIDGQTKVTFALKTEASGFFRVAEPVFARMAKREFASNAGHLKDLLEGLG